MAEHVQAARYPAGRERGRPVILADAQMSLLIVWVVFTSLALVALSAVLVWAVRTHQFTGQDRARYLPLQSGIPKADAPTDSKPEGSARTEDS
jgi:hypothetical protein